MAQLLEVYLPLADVVLIFDFIPSVGYTTFRATVQTDGVILLFFTKDKKFCAIILKKKCLISMKMCLCVLDRIDINLYN